MITLEIEGLGQILVQTPNWTFRWRVCRNDVLITASGLELLVNHVKRGSFSTVEYVRAEVVRTGLRFNTTQTWKIEAVNNNVSKEKHA